MGLWFDIESRLLNALRQLIDPVLQPILKLWTILKGFFTAIIEVIPETITLVTSIIDEVNAWRTFKEAINFKTGVISLQSVRDHIEDLIQELIDAWHALFDLFTSGFKLPLRGVEEAADALEDVVKGFEDLFGDVGLRTGLEKLGGVLKRAGGKVFEILALIQAVAEEALKVVRELQTIVNAIRDVRETFQTGKGLFLSQSNPRKIVRLDDGTTLKLRVGNLHS